MGAKKRKHKPTVKPTKEGKERNQQTIRVVNQILDSKEVEESELRKVASVRGLVNKELRAKAWPQLLGIDSYFDSEEYEHLKSGKHRDSSVVACDVQRSLWFYTEGWSEERREAERRALHSILNAVACKFPDDVFYYQGLHDIASVLLFNAGEKEAFRMLSCMVRCQLRDCTRASLDPVLELLHLLMPLMHEADRELHDHIESSGVPPFFALSWFITWFAHNVPNLDHISRIFDLLLSSHPLMPLYVSVVAMQAERGAILQCEADPSEMHRLLTNMPILQGRADAHSQADELARQAVFLSKRCTPERLLSLSCLHMLSATAPEARLEGRHYVVPQHKVVKRGVVPREMLQQLLAPPGADRLLSHVQTALHSKLGLRAVGVTTASIAGLFAVWCAMHYGPQ